MQEYALRGAAVQPEVFLQQRTAGLCVAALTKAMHCMAGRRKAMVIKFMRDFLNGVTLPGGTLLGLVTHGKAKLCSVGRR